MTFIGSILKKTVFCILCISSHLTAMEYIYPVAQLDQNHFIILYQKSIHHTEIWLWHAQTGQTQKLLLSSYNPAGIQMLPNKAGFSFIDNDHIRIKYFQKRSTKSLEFEPPLYDITTLNWLDDTSFYFSACEHRRYRLYHAHIDGGSICIHGSDEYDSLYPQRVNDSLFFIQRSLDEARQYSLMKMAYPLHANEKVRSLEIPAPLGTDSQMLCQFSQPVAFLSMVSEYEGYILQHPHEIHPRDALICFDFLKVSQTQEGWKVHKEFSFRIPSFLLITSNEQRLFESMLPLLPKITDQAIYYVDALEHIDGLSLGLYERERGTGACNLISNQHGIYCGPLVLNSSEILYGGYINNTIISMTLDKLGILVNLPRVRGNSPVFHSTLS